MFNKQSPKPSKSLKNHWFSMILANPPGYIYVNLSSDFHSILVPKNLQNRTPNLSKNIFAFEVDSETDFWSIWNSIFDNFRNNFGPAWRQNSIQKQSEVVLGVFSVSKSPPKCLPIRFGTIRGAFGDHFGAIWVGFWNHFMSTFKHFFIYHVSFTLFSLPSYYVTC